MLTLRNYVITSDYVKCVQAPAYIIFLNYNKIFNFRQIILIMFNVKIIIFILNYMDIREFYRSNQKSNDQNTSNSTNSFNQNTNENTYQNNSNFYNKKQDFSEYQDTIDKYKDLSQQDLYKELFNQASNLKAQGKLDNNMLNTLSSTLAPMLNDEQKDLLNKLIDRIK